MRCGSAMIDDCWFQFLESVAYQPAVEDVDGPPIDRALSSRVCI